MKRLRTLIIGTVLATAMPLWCHGAPALSDQAMDAEMAMDDAALLGKVLIDQFEAAGGSGPTRPAWDVQAGYGGDYDKLWFKSEGDAEPEDGQESSRNELLWNHALTRWWDLQTGIRYDIGDGPARGWAVLGVEGLAPYWFEVEASLYVGEAGRTAARLKIEHDLRLTQRLILQPEIEANLHGKNDVARDVGSGLSDFDAGVRLRYEIRREFAPYIGVTWRHVAGVTGAVRQGGASDSELQWVAGVHVWF